MSMANSSEKHTRKRAARNPIMHDVEFGEDIGFEAVELPLYGRISADGACRGAWPTMPRRSVPALSLSTRGDVFARRTWMVGPVAALVHAATDHRVGIPALERPDV